MARLTTKICAVLSAVLFLGLGGCGDNGNNAADAGAPDTLPTITFNYSMLQEACVRIQACGVQRTPKLRDCMDNFFHVLSQNGQRYMYERMYDCVIKAKGDCALIRPCMGYHRRPSDPKLQCDSSYVSKCVNNVAHTCDTLQASGEGWERKIDCTKGGLQCGIKETSSTAKTAFCGAGSCTKGSRSYCKDNKLYQCTGGGLEINDCPAQGMQCRDSMAGVCEGTGVSCKAMTAQCKNNVLTACQEGYQWLLDCAKQVGKKKCDVAKNTSRCVGAGTACNEDSFNSCEADLNTLVTCVDGDVKKFDCKAMGFKGCKKAMHGAYCDAAPVYN